MHYSKPSTFKHFLKFIPNPDLNTKIPDIPGKSRRMATLNHAPKQSTVNRNTVVIIFIC